MSDVLGLEQLNNLQMEFVGVLVGKVFELLVDTLFHLVIDHFLGFGLLREDIGDEGVEKVDIIEHEFGEVHVS